MTSIKAINIPEPCHQSWQHMTVNDEGRHCAHCCKTVIDFTRMSDAEIIKHLTVKTNVCGRFGFSQVDNLNNYLTANASTRSSWKGLATALTLISFLSVQKSEARAKPSLIQTDNSFKNKENKIGKDTLPNIVVKGRVIAKDDTLPIQGATIRIKGTNTGTVTDINGDYSLKAKPTDTLVFRFIGYVPQEIPVTSNINISLSIKLEASYSGAIEVTWVSLPRRIWYKVKRLFR